MMRIFHERDVLCPHGTSCPYKIDRYSCEPNFDPSRPIAIRRHIEENINARTPEEPNGC